MCVLPLTAGGLYTVSACARGEMRESLVISVPKRRCIDEEKTRESYRIIENSRMFNDPLILWLAFIGIFLNIDGILESTENREEARARIDSYHKLCRRSLHMFHVHTINITYNARLCIYTLFYNPR